MALEFADVLGNVLINLEFTFIRVGAGVTSRSLNLNMQCDSDLELDHDQHVDDLDARCDGLEIL